MARETDVRQGGVDFDVIRRETPNDLLRLYDAAPVIDMLTDGNERPIVIRQILQRIRSTPETSPPAQMHAQTHAQAQQQPAIPAPMPARPLVPPLEMATVSPRSLTAHLAASPLEVEPLESQMKSLDTGSQCSQDLDTLHSAGSLAVPMQQLTSLQPTCSQLSYEVLMWKTKLTILHAVDGGPCCGLIARRGQTLNSELTRSSASWMSPKSDYSSLADISLARDVSIAQWLASVSPGLDQYAGMLEEVRKDNPPRTAHSQRHTLRVGNST